tara:strand:+ start:13081 stop:15165 length:2085 start_codon:yes stop_codon:yes gene_type:complete
MANTSGIRAGRAYVELGVSDKLTQGLKRAQRRLRTFGNGINALGRDFLKATAVPAGGFLISAKVFTEFDDRMRVVRSVTGATEQQFASLRDEAKRLGAETSFSARQVADAMAELGRAGFTPDQILTTTEAVLALSRATDTELARATEIAGAALRGFNLDVTEMGRVTDVLTATANGSAQTLEDLFEALKPVAPIAAEAGEGIEEIAAAIAVLANNGIKGSLAGNSLARAYKNLSNEAKQAELRKFGVEAVDAAGNMRPLATIINELAKATAGLGSGQRLSIFETLFGRGQAAALKLASSGQAFDDLVDVITNSSGAAIKASEQMDAGVGGSLRKMLSATEAVGIAIGESISGQLKKSYDIMAKVAGAIKNIISNNQELVATAFKVTAAVITAGVALVGVGVLFSAAAVAVGGFITAIGAIVSVAGFVGVAISAIASPIGVATAAFGGFIALVAIKSGAGAAALKFLGDTFTRLAGFVGPTFAGIKNAIIGGDLKLAVEIAGKGMELAWKTVMVKLKSMWIEFIALIQKSVLSVPDKINGLLSGIEVGLDSALGLDGRTNTAPRLPSFQNKDSLRDLIDKGAEDKIEKLTESLDKLKKELNISIESAKNGDSSGLPVFGKISDLASILNQQVTSFAQSGSSKLTARGTFNANAVSGLSGSKSESQRTASATERTATNTKKMIQEIQNIPGEARFA